MTVVLVGYLVGSLPLGLLAGARLGGVDLRRVGSGNVGATNVLRASGRRLGLSVMALDMAKGAGAVAARARAGAAESADPVAAGRGGGAGHVFPVWLRGRGGKGVATACGAFAVLAPVATPWPLRSCFVIDGAGRPDSSRSARCVATVTLPSMARDRRRAARRSPGRVRRRAR